MKFIYIILALTIVLAFAQIMIARSTDSTEQQRYDVLFTEGDFEVRRYDAALLATVFSQEVSIRSSANGSFRRLAGFIFGGNDRGQKIAMTAPVHMEQVDSGSKMSFVMPSTISPAEMPKPQDQGIQFHTSPEEFVAVIRFSGFASDDDIEKHEEKLRNWLSAKGIKTVSGFRYLGYNPPYQLVNRRNEVAVSVTPEGLDELTSIR